MSNRPDIVICMSDQMRFDLRKSKGFALDTMPYLDSLSSEGLEFDKAYTPNPTCMPARVSMFTGRVPSAHHVRTNHNAQDAVYTQDMLDVLKSLGYRTALCGKNHSHLRPSDFDFARVNGHLGIEDGHEINEKEQEVDDFLKTLDFCDSATPSPQSVEEQLPYRNVSDFFTFFDKCRAEGKPSFTWLSFAEPHNPYQVPYPYFDKFPPHSLPEIETSRDDLEGKDQSYEFMDWAWDRVYKEDRKERILRDRSNYYGMLSLIDDQIRRLVEGIRARGALDDTLIIILSDHGEFIGEYGLIRKGCNVAQLLAHIPMVILGHGVSQRGIDGKDFVSIIDIFPTICDMLGVDIPFGVQGKSFLPILSGDRYPEKDFSIAYSESGFGGLFWDREKDALTPVEEGATECYSTFDCLNTWTQSGQTRMVVKGHYKYILNMMGQEWLYDIEKDPLERNNLIGREDMIPIAYDLSRELAAEMMRKSDDIPSCAHRYRTKNHPKRYFFDDEFHVEKDPTVVYHPIECPKRRDK